MSLIISAGLCVGLTACNSTNTSWTKPDDSPWSEKHAAIKSAAPADELVYEPVSLDELAPALAEPVAMEPAPEAMPEPVAMEQVAMEAPVVEQAAAVPAVAEAPVEPVSATPVTMAVMPSTEEIVMAMPQDSYAVQVYASKTMDNMSRFQQNKGLDGLKVVKTDRGDAIYYVLVGLYNDQVSARAAASDLASKTGAKPWVRSMTGLQQVVMR